MTKRKWRPTLSMIVAAMIAVALLLPLTGVLFFRLRRPDWALGEVVPLWLSIVWMMMAAGWLDARAGWLLVPLAFGIVALTFFFGMMLRDQLGGKPVSGSGAAGVGSPLRSFVLLPMDYGTLCLAFLFLPWPTAFLVAYGGLLLANVAFCAQSFVKAYRVLAAPAV